MRRQESGRRFLSAERKAASAATSSARALTVFRPMRASLAQDGTNPPAQKRRLALAAVAAEAYHRLKTLRSHVIAGRKPGHITIRTTAVGTERIDFNQDDVRLGNEAKACLDQIALDLKRSSDARAVIVADSNAKEKRITAKQEKFAARHKRSRVEYFEQQRAVNVKDYLVNDQGIDASRISVATGTGDDQNVQNYLVPAGATFANDVQGTTAVDETTVRPEGRKPLPERHHKMAFTKRR